MSTILVKENELKALAFNKLTQAGLDAQTAQQVADVLVHADITGVHSHGVIRVEHYCTRLNAGGLNPKATFSIEQISPSVAILDSDDGMGHCALIKATDHAISLARETGWVSSASKIRPTAARSRGSLSRRQAREWWLSP